MVTKCSLMTTFTISSFLMNLFTGNAAPPATSDDAEGNVLDIPAVAEGNIPDITDAAVIDTDDYEAGIEDGFIALNYPVVNKRAEARRKAETIAESNRKVGMHKMASSYLMNLFTGNAAPAVAQGNIPDITDAAVMDTDDFEADMIAHDYLVVNKRAEASDDAEGNVLDIPAVAQGNIPDITDAAVMDTDDFEAEIEDGLITLDIRKKNKHDEAKVKYERRKAETIAYSETLPRLQSDADHKLGMRKRTYEDKVEYEKRMHEIDLEYVAGLRALLKLKGGINKAKIDAGLITLENLLVKKIAEVLVESERRKAEALNEFNSPSEMTYEARLRILFQHSRDEKAASDRRMAEIDAEYQAGLRALLKRKEIAAPAKEEEEDELVRRTNMLRTGDN